MAPLDVDAVRTVHEGQSLLSPRVLARLVARMPSAAAVGASAGRRADGVGALVKQTANVGDRDMALDHVAVDAAGMAGAIYVGLFEMAVPFVLWLTALRLTESAARISHLIYLSPILSLVFISVFVGEKILISTLIGLGLILMGTVIQKKC